MADKKRKAPGIFSKAVDKKKWEKKYIKKIYLPEDRKFLESLLVEENGMVRVNAEGLSKKDLKRLKALGKAIKQNRKRLNFILIFILVIVAGGIVFFEFYLKNMLVQRLLETQLEKIFLAQVDTDGVELSIFKGEFSLEYFAVADAQNPMKNLFECSSVTADLDTAELLQGRVLIEELGFSGLKRGTERAESGLLPAPETGAPADKDGDAVPEDSDKASSGNQKQGAAGKLVSAGKDSITDVVNQLGAIAGEIDVEEILAQQKENLESFTVLEDSKMKVEGYAGQWEGKAGEWESRIDGWETSVNYIKTVNAGSFQTLESAQSTISKLEKIYNDAEQDYSSAANDLAAVEAGINEASSMIDAIKTAISNDYDYIEGLVTLPAGEKVDWAASILEEKLSAPLQKYLSYLDRGLEWYGRFKRLSDLKKEKSPEKRRPGRSLPPPADAPPGFVLVHAFASGEEPGLSYNLSLNDLVSEPDKWENETSLEIGIDTPATGAAEALITESSLTLDVPSVPFDLGGSLSALDISVFSGSLSLDSGLGWNEDGFAGDFGLEAVELNLESEKPEGLLYRLVNTSLESVKPLTAIGSFTWNDSTGFDISVETELDDSLGNAASAMLKEGADEGLQMLKDYLDAELAEPLREFDSAREQFESYADKIRNYEQELDKYRSMADDKIAEIEQSVKDNIAKQAEKLLQDAVPDEVEKAAEDAAETLKSTLGSKLKF